MNMQTSGGFVLCSMPAILGSLALKLQHAYAYRVRLSASPRHPKQGAWMSKIVMCGNQ